MPAFGGSTQFKPLDGLTEVVGTIDGPQAVKFHKDSFFIGKVRMDDGRTVGVKGTLMAPQFGLKYTFKGSMEPPHPWYGYTLKFTEYTVAQPTDRDGIVTYLRQTAKWVGPTIANACVDKYGPENVLKVLKNEPERVAEEINGITIDRAKEIAQNLKDNEETEQIEVALRSILAPAGVSNRVFNGILDRYGKDAPSVARSDPYRMTKEVVGVGFLTADKIALAQGLDPKMPSRIKAAVTYVLEQSEDVQGNTCLPWSILLRDTDKLINVGTDLVIEQAELMLRGGEVWPYKAPGAVEPDVYLFPMFQAERGIAEAIQAMLADEDPDRLFREEQERKHKSRALNAIDRALDMVPWDPEPAREECRWQGCSDTCDPGYDLCEKHREESLARLFPGHPDQGFPFPLKPVADPKVIATKASFCVEVAKPYTEEERRRLINEKRITESTLGPLCSGDIEEFDNGDTHCVKCGKWNGKTEPEVPF